MTICSQKVILRTLSMRTVESSPNINQRPDKMRDVRVTELIDEAKEPGSPRRSSTWQYLLSLQPLVFLPHRTSSCG